MSWIQTPPHLQDVLEEARWMGRTYLRPLGLSADAQGGPHPPDHDFYKWYAESGLMQASAEADLTGDRHGGDRPDR